jgi:mono/diheme cytochrome c family protein
MDVHSLRRLFILLAAFLLSACAGSGAAEQEQSNDTPARPAAAGGLTADQLEKGIGPITQVSLDVLDGALAQRGEEIFTLKCSACHKPDERYVGPALGDVTSRRTPEYVMNMILNPAEMIEKHPEARKLVAEFMMAMPNHSLTQDEARAVLEYLRSLAADPQQTTEN